jgi:hypothetical protein
MQICPTQELSLLLCCTRFFSVNSELNEEYSVLVSRKWHAFRENVLSFASAAKWKVWACYTVHSHYLTTLFWFQSIVNHFLHVVHFLLYIRWDIPCYQNKGEACQTRYEEDLPESKFRSTLSTRVSSCSTISCSWSTSVPMICTNRFPTPIGMVFSASLRVFIKNRNSRACSWRTTPPDLVVPRLQPLSTPLIPGLNARHLRLTARTLYFMMQNTACKGDICKRTQIQSSNITSFWRHEMEK